MREPTSKRNYGRVICFLILVMLVVIGPGCRIAAPQRKVEAEIHSERDITANRNAIRLRMRALVDPLCGEIEQSADGIIAGTTNAAIRKAALHWKIEAVPAMREALFLPDPLTALGDAWVLSNQMADYFEKGAGKDRLQEASPVAVATCRAMEEQIAQVAASMTRSGDISRVRRFARSWATEHPIQDSIGSRESILSRVLEREIAASFSTGEAVAEMTTSVDDLNRRLEVYSAQLFRQVRWEAELFKTELLEELSAQKTITMIERAAQSSERAAAGVDEVAKATQRAAKVAEEMPKMISSEREAVLKSVSEDLKSALDGLGKERATALKELREELAEERVALSREMEQTAFKVVDHAIWRETLILAVGFAALIVTGIVGLLVVRRIYPPTNAAQK